MLNKKRKSSEETKIMFFCQNNDIQSTIASNKPLWISDVSQSVKRIFPYPFENKDFEHIKDLMQTETSIELFDNSEYPYYQTIKKIMYAFGDHYTNNQDTIIYMHEFMKKYLVTLNQIFCECDFKKIIDHFYSYEYEKIHNYKKLRFRSNIINGENDSLTGDDIKISINDFNIEIENNKIICNDNESCNFDMNNINFYSKKKTEQGTERETRIEKDKYYEENILFQSQRTENMDTNQYLEYYSCRQHGFLTKGKKAFSDYLKTLYNNQYPNELKENSYLELIAFILKEEIKKIVTGAIKAKHHDRQLFALNYPLTIEDIEEFCQEELIKLTEFLTDFHSDLSLIRIYKKKQIHDKKPVNKNIKIKHTHKGIFIIIKRGALIHNRNKDDQFKTIKKNAETHALNALQLLRNKLIILKLEKTKLLHKTNGISNKINFIDTSLITINDLIDFLGIKNYYEYFLIQDYLFPLKIKEIKMTELISQLKKINKKTLANKFNIWLQMTDEEQNEIITQYNQLQRR